MDNLGNLRLETLRVLVGELSDEDKLSLLELIYKSKTESEPSVRLIYKRENKPYCDDLGFDILLVKELTLKNILHILKDIDLRYRTDFSARMYFTGTDSIDVDGGFDEKSCYNEIGVIANCKLVGLVLLRLVRYFSQWPDEEEIEDSLLDDKNHFNDVAHEYGSMHPSIGNFIKFLASRESEYDSNFILTARFETEVYNRKTGTVIYETDISKVDVWTIARLYHELYEEQIYDRKNIQNISNK